MKTTNKTKSRFMMLGLAMLTTISGLGAGEALAQLEQCDLSIDPPNMSSLKNVHTVIGFTETYDSFFAHPCSMSLRTNSTKKMLRDCRGYLTENELDATRYTCSDQPLYDNNGGRCDVTVLLIKHDSSIADISIADIARMKCEKLRSCFFRLQADIEQLKYLNDVQMQLGCE